MLKCAICKHRIKLDIDAKSGYVHCKKNAGLLSRGSLDCPVEGCFCHNPISEEDYRKELRRQRKGTWGKW